MRGFQTASPVCSPENVGEVRACSELGASWAGGQAICQADGAWRVAACIPSDTAHGALYETVKPAERYAGDPLLSEAVCNDGSPYEFYLRLNPEKPKRWVLYFEGGAGCDGDEDCAIPAAMDCAKRRDERDPRGGYKNRNLTSTDAPGVTYHPDSVQYPITWGLGGIFSTDPTLNLGFHGANHVFMNYCSSDFWTGDGLVDRSTTPAPNGMTSGHPDMRYFRGRIHYEATMEMLKRNYGLQDDAETTVLVSGSSAGGWGVLVSADIDQARLGQAHVYLNPDAAIDPIDWDNPQHRLGTSRASDRQVTRNAYDFWAAKAPDECENVYADKRDCINGEVLAPYVSKPVANGGLGYKTLISHNQLDPVYIALTHSFPRDSEKHIRDVHRIDHSLQFRQMYRRAFSRMAINSLCTLQIFSGEQETINVDSHGRKLDYHGLAITDEQHRFSPDNLEGQGPTDDRSFNKLLADFVNPALDTQTRLVFNRQGVEYTGLFDGCP